VFLVEHWQCSLTKDLADQKYDLKCDYGHYERVDDAFEALPELAFIHDTPTTRRRQARTPPTHIATAKQHRATNPRR
jgi:hypothetical protein